MITRIELQRKAIDTRNAQLLAQEADEDAKALFASRQSANLARRIQQLSRKKDHFDDTIASTVKRAKDVKQLRTKLLEERKTLDMVAKVSLNGALSGACH